MPDAEALVGQHEAFCALLTDLGVQVEVADALDGQVDAVYMHDPLLVTHAAPSRCGCGSRASTRARARARSSAPRRAGAWRVARGAYADGGDRFWIDDRLMAIGLGYRTNRAGAAAVAALAAPEGVAVEAYDVPHDRGPAHVLHLQSFISAVTEQLCVIYEPLAPARLLQDLRERAIRWIAIDSESYEAMGCNILAVHPGVVVMVDGVPAMRRALEREGVEVHVYDGSELSLKGDGGPTCLTAPLLRGHEHAGSASPSRD